MSITVPGHHYARWAKYGLPEFGDFAEKITECNQREWADHTSGEWWYVTEEGELLEGRRAIITGSWGNDNSPGASYYTQAEVYEKGDLGFFEDLKWLESQPEWLDDEEQGDI